MRGIKYLVFSTGSCSLNHSLSVWSPWERKHDRCLMSLEKLQRLLRWIAHNMWVFQMLTITGVTNHTYKRSLFFPNQNNLPPSLFKYLLSLIWRFNSFHLKPRRNLVVKHEFMPFFQGQFPFLFSQREKLSFLSPSYPISNSVFELKFSEIQYEGLKHCEGYM